MFNGTQGVSLAYGLELLEVDLSLTLYESIDLTEQTEQSHTWEWSSALDGRSWGIAGNDYDVP